MSWWMQWLCGLRGHPGEMKRATNGRLHLWCPSCFRESPGWQITAPVQPARRVIPLRLVRRETDQHITRNTRSVA